MKKNLFVIYTLLIPTLTVSAAKPVQQDLKQTESTFELSQKSPDAAFDYYFYEAMRFKQLQKYDSLLYCLGKCEDIYPMNPQVHFEKARVNVTYNRLSDALNEIETAIKIDSTEASYIDMAMNLSYEMKDLPKSIHYAEKLHALRPDKNYYLMTLSTLYSENNQSKEAIKTLDELEKRVGMSIDITKYKFANWISGFHDKKKAIAEYDKLIAAYPAEPEYIKAKADAYAYLGDFKNVEKTLKNGLKKMPESGVMRYEICMYYITKKRDLKKADKYIDPLLESRDIEYEQKMTVPATLWLDSTSRYLVTEPRLRRLINMYPHESSTYALLVDYLSTNNRTEEAYSLIEKSLEADPYQEDMWNTLILKYAVDNNLTAVEENLKKATSYFPNNADFTYRLGRLYYLKGDTTNGEQHLRKAAEVAKPTDLFLASGILGEIGDISMAIGDTAKAMSAYDEALVLNPNAVSVLNNYAYMLAVKGTDLDKAERMSGKTVSVDPNSAVFLDTYAWVYFKKGDYQMSLLYIEQALSKMGEDNAELLEHYGDILYKTGNTMKAREQWNKALATCAKSKIKPSAQLQQKATSGVYVE
ncbi:MAG: tetratricopeptide repeat protein [Bacteroidales bacterium]|nr:tetratricopeptide repeat protein [Candidatus Scybalocola fimicaballi]